MALTGNVSLLDVAKNMPESREAGVILTYATSSHPLMVMPVETQSSGVKKWKLANDLPYSDSASAYRNLEAEYTATKTPVQPMAANFKIAGGRVKLDRVLKGLSPADSNIQRVGQIQAQARQLTKDIFEGAGGSFLWGITNQIASIPVYSGQSMDCGTVSAGAVITEDKLDELISLVNVVPGQTYIYCNDAPTRRIKKLSRGQGTVASGSYFYNINYRPEELGTFIGMYDGIPIITLKDGKGTDLLSNAEGDGSSTTVYIVTYGPENFTGFQVKPMTAYELKEISVFEAFDIEWLIGTAMQSVKCAARMRYVKNAVA